MEHSHEKIDSTIEKILHMNKLSRSLHQGQQEDALEWLLHFLHSIPNAQC